MNDLISRQAAIEDIKECAQAAHSIHEWDMEQGYINAIECLEELPSAQPETQWIPCSEETGDGYPEEDGLYYVTEQNYGFYLDAECKQRVTHTSHFKNGDFTDRFYTENNSNITAWMPLPESYRGGEK